MTQIFSYGDKIYSIDMAHRYFNEHDHKVKLYDVNKFIDGLNDPVWGDVSPIEVLNYPSKHKEHYDRIINADLEYPIYVYKGIIIDGWHRLAKSFLENKKKIKAYDLSTKLIDKFYIGKRDSFRKDSTQLVLNDLYECRFHY